jgi:hypothetical protein
VTEKMRERKINGLLIGFSILLIIVPVRYAFSRSEEKESRDVLPDEKFELILKRAPFGPPPPIVADTWTEDTASHKAGEEETKKSIKDFIRLSAITRYAGVPAAGFFNNNDKSSFFLTEGQTVGDYTLEKVLFVSSSVILTKGDQTEEIPLSYAKGQPTNIVPIAGTQFLTGLDFRDQNKKVIRGTEEEPSSEAVPEVPLIAAASGGEKRLSSELIEAATLVEGGQQRLSFRELHRLRVQEKRQKEEEEKKQREEKLLQEKKQAEAKAKDELLAEEAARIEESLHRDSMIEAIKAGEEVEEGFELTVEEAKSLADAGFAIPEEFLSGDPSQNATDKESDESEELEEESDM